jgi:oxygen-dependent protoporphyrinogen oxidase
MPIRVGIVGGGISGLALGFRLKYIFEKSGVDYSLTIFEKSNRVGGTIHSENVDGFRVEWGPNGFLNNEPAMFELIRNLGIRDRLVVSKDASRKRYLLIGGRLEQVPISPADFISSGILPAVGKLRFAMEPLIPRKRDSEDESVASFVTRRFGKLAVARMFDPLMSGIYAGNVNELSINSTLKVFAAFERESGSVVRGMFARIRQRRKENGEVLRKDVDELYTTSKNPMSGKLLSFRGGMNEIIDALEKQLNPNIRTSTSIQSVQHSEKHYNVEFEGREGKEHATFDILVVAAPPPSAAMFLSEMDPAIGRLLPKIKSSAAVMIALGFRDSDLKNRLDGFGYLVPRASGLRSLGVLWSSSIFPERAPEGCKLLQIVMGGEHDPYAVDEDDEQLLSTAIEEADGVLGVKSAPIMTRVMRVRIGIPQYNVGHQARVLEIEKRLEDFPGLYLAGNGYYGISGNDCVRISSELAERISRDISIS